LSYWSGKKIPPADYKISVSKKEYARDSSFLAITAYGYESAKFGNFNHDEPAIFVDTVLYSPDKLKLFSFLIIKAPNKSTWGKDNFPKAKNIFDGLCLIGFRNKPDTMWKLYEFSQYRPSGFTEYKQVQRLLNHYYFYKFKDDFGSKWDLTIGERSEKFKYNLNEANFWENSIVWRKEARVKGFYNFQVSYLTEYIDSIIRTPVIQYPDSILKLYSH